MAIRDILAAETDDNRRAAEAAAQGRSLTGLSGRHTDIESRFATGDALFGGKAAEPIAAERVERARVQSAPGSDRDDDPMLRTRHVPRPERKPFGNLDQKLYWPPIPGYRLYWFNDEPGAIRRAKEAGYDHVLDPDTAEPVNRVVDRSNGRGRSAYLMKIPREWYEEDMAKQAAELDSRLHDIKTGKAGPGADENRYVPQQGIRITGR
jgi:hypothetical protein